MGNHGYRPHTSPPYFFFFQEETASEGRGCPYRYLGSLASPVLLIGSLHLHKAVIMIHVFGRLSRTAQLEGDKLA